MTKSKAFDVDVDVELYLVGVILVVARSDAQCDTLHNIDEFGTIRSKPLPNEYYIGFPEQDIFKSKSSELFSFSPSAVQVKLSLLLYSLCDFLFRMIVFDEQQVSVASRITTFNEELPIYLYAFAPSLNYDAKATNQGFETILQNGIPSENYLKDYSPLNKNGDKDSEGYRVDWSNRADIYINCSYMNSLLN
ncbi:hypothetical protein GQX74_004927 [Glossina fuscipes]|nr:hypothetical protein GQX74_004927 [Glossina fuscipes]